MKLVKILLGLVIILQLTTITVRTQKEIALEDKVEHVSKQYKALKVRSERQTKLLEKSNQVNEYDVTLLSQLVDMEETSMELELTDPHGNKLLKVGTNIIYDGKQGTVIGYDAINDGYAVSYAILVDNMIIYVYYDEVKEDK